MVYLAALTGIIILVASCSWLFGWGPAGKYREKTRLLREKREAEDVLKYVFNRCGENRTVTVDSIAGALGISGERAVAVVSRLETGELLSSLSGEVILTPKGEKLALEVVRAHRLWERYLADEARMPLKKVHAEAEILEHSYSSEELNELEASLGFPVRDPHGDPIPDASGHLDELSGVELSKWPLNTPAVILHIEDEPEAVFSAIMEHDLYPGQRVEVIRSTKDGVVIREAERECTLSPLAAANILVGEASAVSPDRAVPGLKSLSSLEVGEKGRVEFLADELRGLTRRRLLDLGLTPGAAVTLETPGLFKDPAAYRVRGTLIALRRSEADKIMVILPKSLQGEGGAGE